MKGGTLFSGIGAPELAGPHIDWRWCAEIDPFACALLAERFPDLRNLGDVNRIEPDAVEPVDLVVFGSPCQSFSVAGNRGGAADPRGALAFVALGIIGRIRPRWVVFENVPGLLSSGGGRDFGAILGALAKRGYGLAYRILDAQFFGVPQRRRRVFVVGCLGDWRAAAAVLFERDGLRRDPPPRRDAGEDVARPITSCSAGGSATRAQAVAFTERTRSDGRNLEAQGDLAYALCNPGSGGRTHSRQLLDNRMAVRRLTPRECERLQGLPDDWTAIAYRGKPAADGPRYRAIGNSMAAPVVAWLLRRVAPAPKSST